MRKSLVTFVFVLLSVTVTALAQDACPDLVQQALEYISAQCSTIERNQACYGNLQVNAVPVSDAADFKFDAPGDIASLSSIQSLSLSSLTLPDQWGVMLMSVQANLPDSVPGQNVTMLLFGDVQVENKGGNEAPPLMLDVTAANNVRVRSGPGTQNSQIGSLTSGQTVQTDGRNEAGDWLRVVLADGTAGWVSADLVQISGDASTLAVVEGTEIAGTTYGPMQAFYFTSGIGSSDCTDAPQDGLLIQTPEGSGKVDLLINEVQVSVGSTVYFTAQPSAQMDVAVLEGEAIVTAAGSTVHVPAGTQAGVPLDENGLANGAPELEPLDESLTGSLTALLPTLPQEITPAESLDPASLVVVPLSGTWVSATEGTSITCQGVTVPIPASSSTGTLAFDGTNIIFSGSGQSQSLAPTGPMTYSGTASFEGSSATYNLEVITPESMIGSIEVSAEGCLFSMPFTMTYQGG